MLPEGEEVSVGELTFPANEPVVIEWPEKDKEEVVCGSSATIMVESPGDRTYAGLYTVSPGEIGVDIFRGGALYWSGTLDPEQYEEPYERLDHYDVMLCFQDFGILDRLKFGGTGFVCAADLLRDALAQARLSHVALDYTTLVSSRHVAVAAATSSDSAPASDSGATEVLPDAGDTLPGNRYNSDGTIWIKPILRPFDPSEDLAALEGGIIGGTYSGLPSTPATLDTIAVQACNFYDEDGEPMSYLEVLEGLLLPLGLRLVQRGGTLWVYDLNGLALNGSREQVDWSSDSQTLSADKVASRVKVTYDPNDDGLLLDGGEAMEFEPETHPWEINQQGSGAIEHYHRTFQSHLITGSTHDATDNSFTIHTGPATGLASVWNANKCFKIVPLMDGSDAVGVIGEYFTGRRNSTDNNYEYVDGGWYHTDQRRQDNRTARRQTVNTIAVTVSGNTYHTLSLVPLFTTRRVYVPAGSSYAHEYLVRMLRLKMEMLLDPRYNPFTSADDDVYDGIHTNYKPAYDGIKTAFHYVFVPCEVRLYDAETGGTLLERYDNRKVAMTYLSTINDYNGADISLGWKMGSWTPASAANEPSNVSEAHCWLSWYDNSARESRYDTTGILGWKANRHQIGATNGKLMSDIARMPDGEYMPFPSTAGWIEVTVYDGIFVYPAPRNDSPTKLPLLGDAGREIHSEDVTLYDLRWQLFKHPTIEVVEPTPNRDVVDSDEVKTEVEANAAAKEPIELDTICGTMDYVSPSSRGQLFRIPGLYGVPLPIHRLTRQGETDTPEALLARTLVQQYGTRHTVLSGEAYMDGGGLSVYKERNQGERMFLLSGETQDVIEDVSECRFVQLTTDDGVDLDIIHFADPAVKAKCVANWGGHVMEGEITKAEAAAVTSLGGAFKEDENITSFNELRFFTGLTSLMISADTASSSRGEFYGCTNLSSVSLPPINRDSISIDAAFRNTKIAELDLRPFGNTKTNLQAVLTSNTVITKVYLPKIVNTLFTWAFRYCSALTTLDASEGSDWSAVKRFSDFVGGCTSLTTIIGTITGIGASVTNANYSPNFSNCPLTADSAMVIINGLADLTGKTSKTLTLRSSTKTALTNAGINYDALAAAKNWTIA